MYLFLRCLQLLYLEVKFQVIPTVFNNEEKKIGALKHTNLKPCANYGSTKKADQNLISKYITDKTQWEGSKCISIHEPTLGNSKYIINISFIIGYTCHFDI